MNFARSPLPPLTPLEEVDAKLSSPQHVVCERSVEGYDTSIHTLFLALARLTSFEERALADIRK